MNMQMLVYIELLYFVKKSEIVYFDSFGFEHVSEEIKGFIENKNIKANIFSSTIKQLTIMWIPLHWIH